MTPEEREAIDYADAHDDLLSVLFEAELLPLRPEYRRRWALGLRVIKAYREAIANSVEECAEIVEAASQRPGSIAVGPGLPSSPTLLTQANRVGYRVFMTEREVIEILRERVKANDGNVAATARALGVKKQWLGLVLSGERNPGPKILAKLRLRREVVYLPM